VITLDPREARFDAFGAGPLLATKSVKTRIARILRRWTERRRPAILFVLDGPASHAAVYGEDDSLDTLPRTPIIDVEPLGGSATASPLVFVADGCEAVGYRIADPGAGTDGSATPTTGQDGRRNRPGARVATPITLD
jgi:hypothetical protein